jgi:hypothetical protein
MTKIIPQETIEQKIFLIRSQKIMLSSHLALLYGVNTSALIQAVRRNIERFPEDFMFTLTREEILNLSQFGDGLINFVENVSHCKSTFALTELTQ